VGSQTPWGRDWHVDGIAYMGLSHDPSSSCPLYCAWGIALDKQHWQACKAGFLSVRVLSRLFRRLFIKGLRQLFADHALGLYGDMTNLISLRPETSVIGAANNRAENGWCRPNDLLQTLKPY